MTDALWLSLGVPEGGGTHLLVERSNGRWVTKSVYVHGPAVTTSLLQSVPVSQLEVRIYLAGPTGRLGAEVAGVERIPVTPAAEINSFAELEQIAKRAPSELPPSLVPGRAKLTRPTGADPDSFYRQVAAAYLEFAQTSRSPAIKIADEAGVPVATARSWVREARRRGQLEAGRRGKAG